MTILTQKQISFYHSNGYLVVKDLFSPDALLKIVNDFNQIIVNQLNQLGVESQAISAQESLYANLQQLLATDVSTYLNCLRHLPKLVSLQSLTSDSAIIDLSTELGLKQISTPTSPVVHVSSDKLKIPGGYYGVGEHQDWTSIQGGLKSIVVWIPFMDILASTFPLEIIPGSHLNGVMSGKIEANTYTVDKSEFNEDDFIRPTTKFGDVVVMSVFALHRTGIKNSEGFRLACSMRYEDSFETDFVNRGYPCAYQRSVNREFITPNYPSVQDIKNIFLS